MIERCGNTHYKQYCDYGGRGITVCERWRNSFENFLADMGEKPKGLTLERVDNALGYCPENCKWDTKRNQNRNKRSNIILTVRGTTACLAELCEIFQTPQTLIRDRLRWGWDVERAFFTPTRSLRQPRR